MIEQLLTVNPSDSTTECMRITTEKGVLIYLFLKGPIGQDSIDWRLGKLVHHGTDGNNRQLGIIYHGAITPRDTAGDPSSK